ncbi:hypothetical protein [Fibrella aquatilis]|uniref:Outer membrane protein beta-barrel domain-containing protein n=1 Tax=Fibrella aquatilis TaxID=2817059 RepID=A0A939G2T3_9BACT|nr:hypothetical protein [Fibrella aquatilis]MBO0930035.1 hypothetical protein [Fibrella aquatilis]
MGKLLFASSLFMLSLTGQAQVWSIQGTYNRIGLSTYRTVGSSVGFQTAYQVNRLISLEASIGQTSVGSLTNDFKQALQNELFQSWDLRLGGSVIAPLNSRRIMAEFTIGSSLRLATEYYPIQLYFESVPDGGGTVKFAEGRYLVQFEVNNKYYVGVYTKASFGFKLTPAWSLQLPIIAETSLFQSARAIQAFSVGLGVRLTIKPPHTE